MLVEQHAPAIVRLAGAIVGPASAADVAQETFLAAWQQLPRLRDPAAFDAWLRRICVNRARNWLRRESRQRSTGSLDPADAGVPASGDFTGRVEARAVLDAAFDRLTPEQRAVLALHYSMGYSIADTADALGLRVGTTKSRLSAGLDVLRRALATSDEAANPETPR